MQAICNLLALAGMSLTIDPTTFPGQITFTLRHEEDNTVRSFSQTLPHDHIVGYEYPHRLIHFMVERIRASIKGNGDNGVVVTTTHVPEIHPDRILPSEGLPPIIQAIKEHTKDAPKIPIVDPETPYNTARSSKGAVGLSHSPNYPHWDGKAWRDGDGNEVVPGPKGTWVKAEEDAEDDGMGQDNEDWDPEVAVV